MSLHAEDWKALWQKVVDNVQAHPLPYVLVVILIFGILLGRCSAN